MGSGGKDTLKEIEERLGKETIYVLSNTVTRGSSETDGSNYSTMGRELMLQNELAIMSRKQCILFITGTRPFKSNKYDITRHPNYCKLSDYNPKNKFNIKKYLLEYRRAKLDDDTPVQVIDTTEG